MTEMHDRELEAKPAELRPTVLVVGTGAIGGFYGAKLAQAGARVTTVCRSDYDTVRSRGIEAKSIWGDFHFEPERVIRDAAEYGSSPDYILVTHKVLPEADTAELIKDAVGPETAIVLIQNGVEIEPPVAEAFPGNEIISTIAIIGVSRTGPGRIHHQDLGHLRMGLYPRDTSEKTQRLADLFKAAGVPCRVSDDVVTSRWQKLVWNAPFNPISVLGGGLDTRQMLAAEESVNLVRHVMEEVLAIAEATGHPLPAEVMQMNIDGTRKMVPYKTSMLVDFEAGRPVEVEAILGNAVRAARREGVPAPRLETLYVLLRHADQQNRARTSAGTEA